MQTQYNAWLSIIPFFDCFLPILFDNRNYIVVERKKQRETKLQKLRIWNDMSTPCWAASFNAKICRYSVLHFCVSILLIERSNKRLLWIHQRQSSLFHSSNIFGQYLNHSDEHHQLSICLYGFLKFNLSLLWSA